MIFFSLVSFTPIAVRNRIRVFVQDVIESLSLTAARFLGSSGARVIDFLSVAV